MQYMQGREGDPHVLGVFTASGTVNMATGRIPVPSGGLHPHPPHPDRPLPDRGAGRQPVPHARGPVRGGPRPARRGLGVRVRGGVGPLSGLRPAAGRGRRPGYPLDRLRGVGGRRGGGARRAHGRGPHELQHRARAPASGDDAGAGRRPPRRGAPGDAELRGSRGTTSSPSTGAAWWVRRASTRRGEPTSAPACWPRSRIRGSGNTCSGPRLEYATMEDADAFGVWMAEEVSTSRDLLRRLGLLDE